MKTLAKNLNSSQEKILRQKMKPDILYKNNENDISPPVTSASYRKLF